MDSDTFHLFRCTFTDNTDWYNIYVCNTIDNYTMIKSFDCYHVGIIVVKPSSKPFSPVLFTEFEQYKVGLMEPQRWRERNPVDIGSSRIWCGLKYTELEG